ncbi:hypothetical protein I302_108265 [Kwoniella bestiolae CBS 10118]|uniref:Uncharacterized protein n=1 Tax=Kwoniella bestiolae CBS 10118 TaxID=1296100 RepID=A0A1B9FW72_9TREE|nr:hypothetical protein I302_07368 [Kwoniella bestiolae CBS 10118]OCF23018.1 hypothetical protein I302_07368 [Kwoniella bestiolae CBS 10118]
MPTGLLNLSDEIIQHIAHYVHTDNEIPIPSFNPHWANFADEIDPTIQKDYIAFRSTCTYIRKLCPIGGLHVRMDSWSKLLRWAVQAPTSVKRAVRRMVIDIPRIELYQDKQLANYSIVPIWFTLTSFLRSLSNLEELIIRKTSLCQHLKTAGFISPSSLNEETDFLPHVSSIAIETPCERCTDQISRLLLRAASSLRHVKISPSWKTQRLYQPASSKESEDRIVGRVTTLYWKTFRSLDRNTTLDEVAQTFPNIRNLHLTCCCENQAWLCEPFSLFCCKPTYEERWLFKMTSQDVVGEFDDAGPVEEWNNDRTFDRFLEILTGFKHLEELDCLIEIQMPPHRHELTSISPHVKRSTYDRSQNRCRPRYNFHQEQQDDEEDLYSAMISAAEVIAATIPTLRVGHFWQYISHHHLLDKPFWQRWKWHCQRLSDGVVIELDRRPEEFKHSWMDNVDGCRDWEYEEDDESDDD